MLLFYPKFPEKYLTVALSSPEKILRAPMTVIYSYKKVVKLTVNKSNDGLCLRSSATTAEYPLCAALNKAVAPS